MCSTGFECICAGNRQDFFDLLLDDDEASRSLVEESVLESVRTPIARRKRSSLSDDSGAKGLSCSCGRRNFRRSICSGHYYDAYTLSRQSRIDIGRPGACRFCADKTSAADTIQFSSAPRVVHGSGEVWEGGQ